MTMGRNWLKTLFPASFKGVPFQTEHDEEEGGRRIVIHEFPMRDDPFNEDLGEAKREFEITAYVASDNVESEAGALLAVMAQRGPGTLVLPTHGPLWVRCLTFKRNREKDKAGKIAISAKFVREGAATALISFASLANLVYASADNVTAAVSTFAEASIAALLQPEFVIASAASAVEDGAAILEAVRTTASVDPVVSATQRDAIQALFNAAPSVADRQNGVDGSVVAGLVTIARALGDGMTGDVAVPAFEQVLDQVTIAPQTPYLTPSAQLSDQNRLAIYLAIRMAAMTAYAEGIARATIPDRQTAIALRANAAEYFEATLDAMSADDAALYLATLTLRGSVIDYLSRAILDRAPVIAVHANLRMPSLWWAHRLYQDPTRSTELATRNRVPHPSFMPTDFEALSR